MKQKRKRGDLLPVRTRVLLSLHILVYAMLFVAGSNLGSNWAALPLVAFIVSHIYITTRYDYSKRED